VDQKYRVPALEISGVPGQAPGNAEFLLPGRQATHKEKVTIVVRDRNLNASVNDTFIYDTHHLWFVWLPFFA
jgi:hypothetical protein